MGEYSLIKNCKFILKCPQIWEELSRTDTDAVRFCNLCDRGVYLADDEEAFGALAATGKCVAVPVESTDTPGDDNQHAFLLGIPSDDTCDTPQWPLFMDCAHEALRGNAPGCLLNDNEPGSDGNYYSIDRNAERQDFWDLFQCTPQYFFAPGFEVSPIAVGLTVEELYSKLESVNIFIQGHEAIALGLPYHGGHY